MIQRKTLLIVLFFSILSLTNACKKEVDEGGMDFKINGLKDITLTQNTSISRTLTLLYLGGNKEEVTFSVVGAPTGMVITTDPDKGIPDFFATQTISLSQVDTGMYTVVFTGNASSGKVFTKSFNVHVVAKVNISPSINLNGTNPFTVTLNSSYIEPGFTAVDQEDGNISSSVSITNNINIDSIGQYNVTYVVYDSGGLKDSVVRTIFVKNSLDYLKGQYTCSTTNFTTSNSYDWITSLSPSVSVNYQLKLFKISDCFMADPILIVDSITNAITIPQQTFYCASSTDTTNHTFVGTGQISNFGSQQLVKIDYQVTYFSSLQGMIVTESRRDSLLK